MTIMARFGGILFLIVAALQFVAARPGQPDSSNCQPNEFWFEEKNCCLPLGGPDSHPSPPAQKQCPPNGWSWSDEHDCCIPHSPRPRHKPPPRCSKDWDWESANLCCKPHQPPHPRPSGGGGNWKRAPQSPLPQLCPMGLRACPISGASTLSSDYECLDTTNELESCGGCASTGEGEDCTAIKGAWNVGCERGTCAVYTCAAGFKRSRDGNSCVTV